MQTINLREFYFLLFQLNLNSETLPEQWDYFAHKYFKNTRWILNFFFSLSPPVTPSFFPFTHFHIVSVSVRARLGRSSGPDGVNWRPPPSLRVLHSWLWGFSCLQLWAWSQHRPTHQDLRARVILQGLCHHRHGNARELNPSCCHYVF